MKIKQKNKIDPDEKEKIDFFLKKKKKKKEEMGIASDLALDVAALLTKLTLPISELLLRVWLWLQHIHHLLHLAWNEGIINQQVFILWFFFPNNSIYKPLHKTI